MKTRTASENGFASIVIAIVLVLVLSLITVGFAELMRHEERSALDKQLSSQAYYAAESGINDATKAINDGYTGTKTNCDADPSVPDLADNTVKFPSNGNNPTNASYPCLLINPAPPDLHYDPILTTLSRTTQFTAIDSAGLPAAVSKIKISWQDSGTNTHFVGDCNTFPTNAAWSAAGNIGVLRAQVIPLIGSLDRTSLTNVGFTGFLCPSNNATNSTVTYDNSNSPANAGVLMNGNCSTSATPLYCNATVNFVPALTTSTFFLNLRSLYSATSVTITAYDGAGTPLGLQGAQTLVDSTGKAQDVERRIQVRVASKNGFDIPDGTHGDICKQFDLDPSTTTSGAPAGSGCDAVNLTY